MAGLRTRNVPNACLSLKTNIVREIFDEVNLQLVDFKLEFGRFDDELFWAMNLVPMAVVSGTKQLGKKWIKIVFERNWAECWKHTVKWLSDWASCLIISV